MTRLSININKIALLRNARNTNLPNLAQVALDCQEFGAHGITIHPRPDERHIRYNDIPVLKELISTEFNIEGYPSKHFLNLVCKYKPEQCTLVPDPPGVLTSSEGWNTIENKEFLKDTIVQLKENGIRVSLFMDPLEKMIEGAKNVDADRVELYTGKYAEQYLENKELAVIPHINASKWAMDLNLGLNAGHDLNLDNLSYYKSSVFGLLEVSIGHALVCDSLYYGLKNTIQMYLHLLE